MRLGSQVRAGVTGVGVATSENGATKKGWGYRSESSYRLRRSYR